MTVDFCIVGSGAAGSLLASRLVATGKRVLVLEQGRDYPPAARGALIDKRRDLERRYDFDDDWPEAFNNARVISSGGDRWDYSSVAAVGGTTLHWEAATPRPRADDMQVRTRFGYGRDWPLGYDELEPWLVRAERTLGVAANDDNPYASPRSEPFPMPAHPYSHFERALMAPAFDKLGWRTHSRPNAVNSVPYQGRPACVACRMCTACPTGARYSADQVHLAPLRTAGKAAIETRTKLIRLETTRDGRRIAAAHAVRLPEAGDGDGAPAEVVVRADVFVLAMGAVETPRMLMLSRDSRHHPGGLGNAGGQLGVGFSDHIMSAFWLVLDRPVGRSLGFPAMGCDHHRAPPGRDQHGSFYISLWPSPIEGDWIPSSMFTRLATHGDTLSLTDMRAAMSRAVAGLAMHELRGHTLSLDRERTDAFDNPLPNVSITLTDWERAGPAEMVRVLADMASAFRAEVGEAWSAGKFFFSSHPSGAAAMAASPRAGVCDANLKVFGVDNLYLATSAVIPHQGANNPTLTIAALALRLAAHLGANPKKD